MSLPQTTITSANSILLLSIASLYPTPQRIQGYSADEAFSTEAVTRVETMIGVDGFSSAGYTPIRVPFSLMLQADSPSLQIFEDWDATQVSIREVLLCQGTLIIPSTGRKYDMKNGVLKSFAVLPTARKVLQPRTAALEFGAITPANV